MATVILAESDGQLCLSHNGRWQSASRPGQKPFALAIPGIAAIRHDTSQWHDATSQNAALVNRLETWLYEKIESELKG